MSMSRSEKMSRRFYDRFGAKRLAFRTAPEWDAAIVGQLKEMLEPAQRILDVGCGYGRVAIPLAAMGHEVVGVDISCELLRSGKVDSDSCGAGVYWMGGSMCSLPVKGNVFDVALCLWSAFNELLEEKDQLSTLKGVYACLRPGGWALFEGPPYSPPLTEEMERGSRYGEGHRISADVIGGLKNHHYHHDRTSLEALCNRAGIPRYEIYEAPWAGRMRLFLKIWKD